MSKGNYSLFDGYTKSSKRYRTKRQDEKRVRKKNVKRVLKQIEKELLHPENFTIEEYAALEKRAETLRKEFPIENKKDTTQNFIPFKVDHKTVIFVREKHCFKAKWLARFGRKRIEETIEAYHEELPKKPEGMIYWNPFINK